MPEGQHSLTFKIITGMLLGMVCGLSIYFIILPEWIYTLIVDNILDTGGKIFINIMRMLVVPVVLVSLIGGVANLGDPQKLGRIGLKTVALYLCTTAIAITLAILVASVLQIGKGSNLTSSTPVNLATQSSFSEILLNMIPSNPFMAMAEGNMLQIILFSILFGFAITMVGKPGRRITAFFKDIEAVIMQLVIIMVKLTPYGVFCLIAHLFAKQGLSFIGHLVGYFFTVLSVLFLHLLFTNSLLLGFLARLNPIIFFRKMIPAMLFAFSTSSSNVSIPIVMETVEDKLGVKNSVASFVVPLGATINMDGTAIMQGVATVFIANVYNIPLGITGFLTVILTAVLASIGTAGVPGVGLITLAMVLRQVGLPVEGIALIIGADRLLDMIRTAVNITGDAMVSCLVASSEKNMNKTIFYDTE